MMWGNIWQDIWQDVWAPDSAPPMGINIWADIWSSIWSDIWGTGSSNVWVTTVLSGTLAPPSERLKSIADLQAGDSISVGNIQGTGNVIVYVDASYSYPPTVTAFSFTVDDGTGDSSAGVITTTVSTNTPPTDIALSATSVLITTQKNIVVAQLTATDPGYPPIVFTLVSGVGSTNNAGFHIVGNELLVDDAEALGAGSYNIRIRATNSINLYYEEAFVIQLTRPSISVHKPSFRILALGTDSLVTGDDFDIISVCYAGSPSVPYDLSAATRFRAAVISADHSRLLCDAIDITNLNTNTSLLAVGQVNIKFPLSITSQIPLNLTLSQSMAHVELEVLFSDGTFAWFSEVQVIAGLV